MWRCSLIALACVVLAGGRQAQAQDGFIERPDWELHFRRAGVEGTIVVADERKGGTKRFVFHERRARQRWIPASTFKIAHALFALDAGAVRDEFQVFPWDGVQHEFPGHNQDQDLRSSMRVSAVWVYEQFARQIGKDKARDYLQKAQYGNVDPGGESFTYWLDGNLRISPVEQIAFLQRLFRNELPFKIEHQRLVKDVLINEAGKEWILRAKTGWTGQQGWWVGWVEWPTGPVFFALHIDTPRRGEDLPKREAITRAILRSLNALP